MGLDSRTLLIGVTGAQGVGKTTFCERLHVELKAVCGGDVHLLDGLGDKMRAAGVPVGSAANADTIAAFYAAQLLREAAAPRGIVILERCAVDALAYTRSLAVTSPAQSALYEAISTLMISRLHLVIHLEMSSFFKTTTATHETPLLRASVASEIPRILSSHAVENMTINAYDTSAATVCTQRISSVFSA